MTRARVLNVQIRNCSDQLPFSFCFHSNPKNLQGEYLILCSVMVSSFGDQTCSLHPTSCSYCFLSSGVLQSNEPVLPPSPAWSLASSRSRSLHFVIIILAIKSGETFIRSLPSSPFTYWNGPSSPKSIGICFGLDEEEEDPMAAREEAERV